MLDSTIIKMRNMRWLCDGCYDEYRGINRTKRDFLERLEKIKKFAVYDINVEVAWEILEFYDDFGFCPLKQDPFDCPYDDPSRKNRCGLDEYEDCIAYLNSTLLIDNVMMGKYRVLSTLQSRWGVPV